MNTSVVVIVVVLLSHLRETRLHVISFLSRQATLLGSKAPGGFLASLPNNSCQLMQGFLQAPGLYGFISIVKSEFAWESSSYVLSMCWFLLLKTFKRIFSLKRSANGNSYWRWTMWKWWHGEIKILNLHDKQFRIIN